MNDGSTSWRLGDVVEVMGDGIEISGGGYHLFASSITARRVEVRKRNGAGWEKEEGRVGEPTKRREGRLPNALLASAHARLFFYAGTSLLSLPQQTPKEKRRLWTAFP